MSKTKQKACLEQGRRVIVAMSGGVDSSVAVFLLKKAGYEVEGVTMKTVCYKSEEILNAKKVCKTLGIPHHTIDVSKKFQKKVIDNFFTEYKAGRTPNPCVKCNQFIKFGELLKFAKKKGADFLATGHYAKIVETRHASSLHRGKDLKKDQTYFLYNLTQKQLSQILFPLGDYNKEDIKKIAKKHKLKTNKQESQEICFIKSKLPFYTIGQRAGIGGKGPYYIIKFDKRRKKWIVTNDPKDSRLYSKKIKVKNVNWISGVAKKAMTQVRYNDIPIEATIKKEKKNYIATFKKPKRAVAPGQSAVFYKNDECLGGGIIA